MRTDGHSLSDQHTSAATAVVSKNKLMLKHGNAYRMDNTTLIVSKGALAPLTLTVSIDLN